MTLYVQMNGACPFNIDIGGTGGPLCCHCCRLLGVIFFANTGVKPSAFWGKFRPVGTPHMLVLLLLLLLLLPFAWPLLLET